MIRTFVLTEYPAKCDVRESEYWIEIHSPIDRVLYCYPAVVQWDSEEEHNGISNSVKKKQESI